jgi:hypothetical protein
MKWNNLFAGAFLIILAILLTSCNKDEDNPYKSYAGSLGRSGYCSVINSEGDLYVVGSQGSDILVLKTSPDGNLIWEKTYNLFGPGVSSNGWTIEETFDNCFLISVYDSWDIYYNGLLKINATGDSIWSIILQDSGYVALKAVAEAADHSIIVVHEEETDIYQDLHKVTISKISQDGELLTSKVHPEIFNNEVYFHCWQANEDGNVIFSTSRYNLPGSIWTVSPGLDIINQVEFQAGKEVAYLSESPGTFICSDEVYEHSKLLPLSKESPGNDPVWEQEILMPCQSWSEGWADHIWIGPASGGYMALGVLYDEKKSQYYMHNSFCMGLDAAGNQTWIWYDEVSIYGIPYNFHSISEDEYLIVGRQRGAEYHIVLWRLKNGIVIN